MPRSPLSMPRLGGAVAIAALVVGLLSGCLGSPAPTASPTPSAAADPVFASDEEALAAAVAAYEAYRAASAEISMDGGTDANRIRRYVSERFASTVLDEFAALKAEGLRMLGTTAIDTTSLASWSSIDGTTEVSIYLCRDVSGARAVNASGEDVTPDGRDDRVPLQAHLVSDDEDPHVLVVDGVEQWPGDDFC